MDHRDTLEMQRNQKRKRTKRWRQQHLSIHLNSNHCHQILTQVNVITPSNASIVPEYIILNVRAMYAQCIAPLAQTADRYLEMGQALKAYGGSPGINGDRQEYEEMHFEASHMNTLCFSPYLRLVDSQRTNDVILSHTITYLNDRDWHLRHAFFESIVNVAACAGGRSLDEYILPLMMWKKVARVLAALTSLCELGLFQKIRIWELMSTALPFFYHSNDRIRQGAASLIAAVAKCLPQSDVWCIIYPSLRHLLRSDVKEVEEQSLLLAMKSPTSIQGGIPEGKHSFHEKGGKHDYWTQQVRRNLGMTSADEAKLTAMRDYILKLANNASSSFASRPKTEPEFERNIRSMGDIELQKLSVVPQTVFLKSKPSMSDLIPRPSRLASYSRRPGDLPGRFNTPHMSRASSVDRGATNPALEDLKPRLAAMSGSSSSLNLTATARERQATGASRREKARATARVGDVKAREMRALSVCKRRGRTEARTKDRGTDGRTWARRPRMRRKNTRARRETIKAPSKMRAEGSPEQPGRSSPISLAGIARGVIRPRIASMLPISTYDGPEPGINNCELQHDFDPKMHEGPIRRRNTARQSFITRDSNNRRTEATLIAHLQSHTGCVTGLAVSPDDMSVKVWDTAQLERSVTSKPCHTYSQHHACVKSVCILEGVHCFASAAEDGSLHVIRVHVNQSGSLPKYAKLQTIREYRVDSPGEYITCMIHYNSDRKRMWILVGTSMGVLSLWDRHFGLLMKSWQVGKSSSGKFARVNQCIIHPTKGKGTWVTVAIESWKGGLDCGISANLSVHMWWLAQSQNMTGHRTDGSPYDIVTCLACIDSPFRGGIHRARLKLSFLLQPTSMRTAHGGARGGNHMLMEERTLLFKSEIQNPRLTFKWNMLHQLLAGVVVANSSKAGMRASLKDSKVQERYRVFVGEKLHKFWTEKQTKDGQENILILFRKLREGIFASKQSDAYAIEATSLRTLNHIKVEALSWHDAHRQFLSVSKSSDETNDVLVRLSQDAVHALVERLRSKARDKAWVLLRSAYRELSASEETQTWMAKCLLLSTEQTSRSGLSLQEWMDGRVGAAAQCIQGAISFRRDSDLDGQMLTAFNRADEWMDGRCRDGHLRPKEGAVGRWIVCKNGYDNLRPQSVLQTLGYMAQTLFFSYLSFNRDPSCPWATGSIALSEAGFSSDVYSTFFCIFFPKNELAFIWKEASDTSQFGYIDTVVTSHARHEGNTSLHGQVRELLRPEMETIVELAFMQERVLTWPGIGCIGFLRLLHDSQREDSSLPHVPFAPIQTYFWYCFVFRRLSYLTASGTDTIELLGVLRH
ncbi:hypothetical protein EV424DRAFT_1352913 [Suillus variegatus]|nr:hypothetical protein EV424DRAFT_1352913 [Suillus variegatus]